MVDDRYYQMARPEIVPLVPADAKRILEIGCGAGAFRRNFRGGIDYWGVEPVDKAAIQAETTGMKVLHGTFDEVQNQIPDGYFDVVVCNDVIEHIADTDGLLTSIGRKLKPQGILVGSIPNIRFLGILKMLLLSRDWQYVDSGIMDRTHLRFFTPKSFQLTLQKNHFSVELLEGIGSRKMAIIKKVLKPVFWLVGEEICHMQYKFRARQVMEAH